MKFVNKKDYYSDPGIVDDYQSVRYEEQYALSRELQVIGELLPEKGTALDVPYGYGRVPQFLVRKELVPIGLDYSIPMLSRFKKSTGLNPIQADIAKLPLKPETFDAILSIRFLHNYPDIGYFLKEYSELVKKDGVIIFETYRWSLKAFTFVNWVSKGGKDYLHQADIIESLLAPLSMQVERKTHCFLCSPWIYRFLPKPLVFLFDKLEPCLPDGFKTVVFWKLRKQ